MKFDISIALRYKLIAHYSQKQNIGLHIVYI